MNEITPIFPDGAVPKSVLLFSRIDFAWLNPILMKRMRERFGTRFVVVAPNSRWADYYQPHCDENDRVIISTDIADAAEAAPLDENATFDEAREREEKYGQVYLRDIIQQARNVSAYYLQYAPNSPFSSRRPPPLAEITKQINYFCNWFSNLLDEEQIDLVVERPGDLMSSACLLEAEVRDIPTTFWLPARYESNVMWSVGPYLDGSLIEAAYNKLSDPEPVPTEALKPPDDSRHNFEKADVLRSHRNLLREFFNTTRDYAIWGVQEIISNKRSNRMSYMASMKYYYSVWYAHRAIDSLVESDMDRLCERPFVLFLMQFEPEYTTLSLSREFNDTRAFIQQLALSIPSGYNLVIKENVNSIGNRKMSFYEDMLRFPNVILADHRLPGISVMERAEVVATVSSTGALEANLFGKPSIIMAQHLEFAFLPDVHQVRSLMKLPQLVKNLLRPLTDKQRRIIRVHASKYRQALKAVSFSAPNTRPFRGTATDLPKGEDDKAVDRLVDCFRLQKSMKNTKASAS